MQSRALVSPNSLAIALFCSKLETDNQNCRALTTKEWSQVALQLMNQSKQPCDITNSSTSELIAIGIAPEIAERMYRLAQRSIPLGFRLNQLNNQGIHLITRADSSYPQVFKRKLNQGCPPLFYVLGNLDLLNSEQLAIGVVGSRSILAEDEAFTKNIVSKFVDHGYVIVSGGAKGTDATAINQALDLGGNVVIYTDERLDRQMRKDRYAQAIHDGQLVIVAAHNPDVGFSTAVAMMRNRFIYVHSHSTLVVKSDANKGGTWAGATDSLKHGYAYTLCRDIPNQGNKLLIEQGAFPISDKWDGDVLSLTSGVPLAGTIKPRNKSGTKATQDGDGLSLFSGINVSNIFNTSE